MALLCTNVVPKIFGSIISRSFTFKTAGGHVPELNKKTNLEHKVAAVTGGASGIGCAIAKALLKEGISAVSLIDTEKKKLEDTAKILGNEFGEDRILQIEADVSDIEQMDSAFRSTVLYYHVIDIIINNAGFLDDGKWEKQLKTNLNGCVIGTLLGMQYMARSSEGNGGIIVNVGSIMSIIPSAGFPIYTMTQFGIAGFSKALGSSQLYERTGVKVFGYCPGLTNTKMLDNISTKCINMNFASEFQVEIENCRKQTPEHVAKCLVGIIDDAKPGSLWLVENGKEPYEVELKANVKKNVEQTEELSTI